MRQAESLRHGCGEAALCHQALQLLVAQRGFAGHHLTG